jgi:hypothetical protein
MKTYRSPGGPPFQPNSPSPRTRRREPSLTPAGIFTSLRARAPRRARHARVLNHLPCPAALRARPRHGEEVLRVADLPRPPQREHVTGDVPGLAPDPLHVVQVMTRGTPRVISLPNAASMNSISRSSRRSLPIYESEKFLRSAQRILISAARCLHVPKPPHAHVPAEGARKPGPGNGIASLTRVRCDVPARALPKRQRNQVESDRRILTRRAPNDRQDVSFEDTAAGLAAATVQAIVK